MNATLPIPVEMFAMNAHDLEAVAALEAEAQPYPWSRGNFADSLVSGYAVWICRIGGDLVGFSVVMAVLDEAHLLNFAVARNYRGLGYGARLLQHAMQQAARGGASRFFLEVRMSNRRAIDLYKNFGFRQIGLRRAYYPAAAGREDALVFERELR